MATHLTIFDNEEQYLEFLNSDKFKRPNISYLLKKDSRQRDVQYKKYFKPSKISFTFNTTSAETVAFNAVPEATTELFIDGVKTPFTKPEETERVVILNDETTPINVYSSAISFDYENETLIFSKECTFKTTEYSSVSLSLINDDVKNEDSFDGIFLYLTNGIEYVTSPLTKNNSAFDSILQYDEVKKAYKINDMVLSAYQSMSGIYMSFVFFKITENEDEELLDTTMHLGNGGSVFHMGPCTSWTFETLNNEVFQDDDILFYDAFFNGNNLGIQSGTVGSMNNDIFILNDNRKEGKFTTGVLNPLNNSFGFSFYFTHADGTPLYTKHIIKGSVGGEPVVLSGTGTHTVNVTLQGNTIPVFRELSSTLTNCKIFNAEHIADNVFEYCTNLTSISLPNTLKTIGSEAFIWCDKLSSISLPNSITSIGSSAFESCKGLTSISISDSVTAIQPNTFYNCTKLSSVKLGKNVISIGNDAFENCSNLTSINFPEPLKTIGESAFYSCSLREITLKRNLKSIGNNAFSNCSKLSKITSHAAIAPSIGKNTFYNVSNFGRLITPDGSDYSNWLNESEFYLGYYGWNGEAPVIKCTYNVTDTSVATNLIYSYSNVSSISIDGHEFNSVVGSYVFSEVGEHSVEFTLNNKTILANQFNGCVNLSSVEISDMITSIGNYAFYDCSNLMSINIGSGIASMGNHLFDNCHNLTSITVSTANTVYDSRENCNCLINTSANTIITGTSNSFIPEGITHIGGSAFTGCYNLMSINIPESVTSIGNCAFRYCHGLSTVVIPDSVTEIGIYSFSSCSTLTSLSIGSGLTTITNSAFEYCDQLKDLTIGTGVTTIGKHAFYRCYGLTSIVIPDSVTTIDDDAFFYCNNMVSLTIGSGITSIGQNAFETWYGDLKEITITAPTAPSIKNYTFHCAAENGVLYYPKGSDYSSWLSTSSYYLGYYNWLGAEIGMDLEPTLEGYDVAVLLANYSETEKICNTTSGIYEISVDGVKLNSVSTGYTFGPTKSYHIVRYKCYNKSIAAKTFYNCSNILSVKISSNITSVGNSAFTYDSKIKTVEMPDSIKTIGSEAFYNCTGLTSIHIGSGVTNINKRAFMYCGSLSSITVSELNSVYDSRENSNCIINTSANTIIQGCNNSFIPEGITCIGENAFNGCYDLAPIELPETVISIGYGAFSACRNISSITIPNSVTTIGAYAFSNCSNLSSLNIGDGVTSIDTYAFGGCSSLSTINVSDNNTAYDSRENCNCLINTSDNTVLCGCKNSFIPNTVSKIGDSAFTECDGLTVIDIPESVVSIGSCAFYGCNGLTSVVINNAPATIGNKSFYSCDNLSTLSLGNNITSIEDSAFTYCYALSSLNVPDSVKTIGKSAFKYCQNITTVTIGNGIETIGSHAFYDCKSLSQITITAPIAPPISANTFANVVKFGVLNYPENSDYSEWLSDSAGYLGNYYWNQKPAVLTCTYTATTTSQRTRLTKTSGVTSMTIDGVKLNSPVSAYTFNTLGEHTVIIEMNCPEIPHSAFTYCGALISVNISDTVTSIGNMAFCGCSGLSSIVIPKSATSLGHQSFVGCHGLKTVEIPDSVKTIGSSSFSYCSGLTSFTFGKGVKVINSEMFLGCSALTSINIPENITTIGQKAFYYCRGLSSVIMSNSVTSIGNSAFTKCHGITTIEIPDSVQAIGGGAFYDCNGLSLVTIGSGLTSLSGFAFSSCDSLSSITVSTANTVYDSREGCNCIIVTSSNTIVQGCNYSFIPEDIISIGNCAFYECSILSSVTFVDTITSIGNYAFYGCSALTEIIFPESVKAIGNYAFYGCNSLMSINIPYSVTSIGTCTFASCNNLSLMTVSTANTVYDSRENCNCLINTSANTVLCGCKNSFIPNTVSKIEARAFYSCEMLLSIEIPESVTYIGESAFTYCNNLEEIIIPDSVTYLGGGAFYYCRDIETVTIGNGVSQIGGYTFQHCSGLTSLTIGSGVTTIGRYAFEGCYNLCTITITAPTAPTLYETPFYNCTGDGILYYPKGSDYSSWLSTNYQFLGYKNWFGTEVDSEPELTLDGYDVAVLLINFSTTEKICNITSGFTEISVDGVPLNTMASTYTFGSTKGYHIIRYKCVNNSIDYRMFYVCDDIISIKFGPNITSIAEQSFAGCSGLTSIEIPDSITTINNESFYECKKLKNVYIGSGTTYINPRAFNRCGRIRTISVSLDNVVYDSREDCNCLINTSANTVILGCKNSFMPNGITAIGNSAFTLSSCPSIINLPNSVEEIGTYAFYYCGGLLSITFGDSLTSIGYYAFYYCTGLTSVELPASVTYIDNYAFDSCKNIQSITVSTANTVYDSRENCNCLINTSANTVILGCKNSFIPDGVERIGGRAFAFCNGLTSIVFPDSIVSIGQYAFDNCQSLTGVTIGSGLTNIATHAFRTCNSLRKINFPSSLKTIDTYAFDGCGSLNDIYLPESVSFIGEYAFHRCGLATIKVDANNKIYDSREDCNCIINTSANTIIVGCMNSFIPEGVTEIGRNSFRYCYGLSGELVIPDSVKTIGSGAFCYCTNVTSITIGSGVTSIGSQGFYNLNQVNSITITAPKAPSISYEVFRNIKTYGTLYYPSGSDYSSWLSTGNYYLGIYGWVGQEIS